MCYLHNSACSWQGTNGHVPGSRGLLKKGLERELRRLDSKNSALPASPHRLTAMVLPGVRTGFLRPLQEHLNAHVHACLCTRSHIHVCTRTRRVAYMHTHTNVFSVSGLSPFSHRAVSVSPLRAGVGPEGVWGRPSSMWLGWSSAGLVKRSWGMGEKAPLHALHCLSSSCTPPRGRHASSSSCSGPCLTQTALCTRTGRFYGTRDRRSSF